MLQIKNFFRIVCVLFSVGIHVNSFGQQIDPGGGGTYGISGPTTATVTDVGVYTIDPTPPGGCTWNITKGHVTDATNNSATIVWDEAGGGLIEVYYSSTLIASYPVNVSAQPTLYAGSITSPTTQYINYNTAPVQCVVSSATGGYCNGSYIYQWQASTGVGQFADIPGATSQNYQPGNLTTLTRFRRKDSCNTQVVYTNLITVNVYDPLVAGTISPSSQAIVSGSSGTTLSISGVSGGNGSYSYQWYRSGDNNTWTPIGSNEGGTSSTFTPAGLTSTTYYKAGITSNNYTVYAQSVIVNVYTQLWGGSITPSDLTISYNTSPGTLTLSGMAGGNGSYTYQWQQSNDGNTYNNINVNNLTYQPGTLTSTQYYRVNVTSIGYQTYSQIAVIHVAPPLTGGNITGSVTNVSYNGSPGILDNSILPSGGNCSAYSFQWQQSGNGADYYDISGATVASYTPVNLINTTYFRRKATCSSETAYSNVIVISVNPLLSGGLISPSETGILSGASPGLLTASMPSGGKGCTYGYQWQQSTNGINYYDITGATGPTYSPGNLFVNTYFRRKVICDTDNSFSDACTVTVGTAGVSDMNYVRLRNVNKPGVLDINTAASLTDVVDVAQNTDYIDGLGRLIQTVNRRESPQQLDFVTNMTYNKLGQQYMDYLPYVASSSDGEYKSNSLSEQRSFNEGLFRDDQYYYGLTNYETSMLNRQLAVFAPGNNWVGAGRSLSKEYLLNTSLDSVRIWTIDRYNVFSTVSVYSAGQLYKNVTIDEHGNKTIEYKDKRGRVVLKKMQLIDQPAEGHTGWLCTYYVYDDFDKLRVVLQPRAVELMNGNWTVTQNIIDEYCFLYEYDERDRMITKKTAGIGQVWMVYDIRDRLVFTQDANMRSQSQWLTTLYDGINRPVITAFITNTGDRAAMQQLANVQTSYSSTTGSSSDQDIILTGTIVGGTYLASNSVTIYGDAATADGAEITFGIGTTGNDNSESTLVDNINVNLYPLPSDASLDILTESYYDNYDWVSNTGSSLNSVMDATNTSNSNYFNTSYNSSPLYARPIIADYNTRSLVTGSKIKILGTSTYLYTVDFYDDQARIIQSQSTNITGGKDIVTTQYDFTGKSLRRLLQHGKGGGNAQTHMVLSKFTYDHAGRLLTIAKTLNSTINGVSINKPEVEIVSNEYDALGQLKKKNVGKKKDVNGAYTSAAMQELTYDYNIRGWLLGVNRDYLATEGQTNNGVLFGFELGYDKTTNTAGQDFAKGQYNGNIAGILWKSDGDDIRRKYDFIYDATNRLLKGDFTQQNADDHQWNNSQVNYNVKMGDGADPTQAYDANGNILRMQQWGLMVTGSTQIDDLHYSYYNSNNSNKLREVTDQAAGGTPSTATYSILGDFTDKNTTGNDYGYDQNGNMVTDLNKKLKGIADLNLTTGGAITYNHLNLPSKINVVNDNGSTNKGTITYTYDANGKKLQKIVWEQSATVIYNKQSYSSDITTTTTYLDGFVYESKQYSKGDLSALQYTDKLQFLIHEEGKIRYLEADSTNPAHFEYDYFIKDHLGNVRMVLTEEQKTDIYQAGMEVANRDAEVKLFGDKINTTATDKYGDFDSDTSNHKVSVVNGTTEEGRVGPGVILKVMAGDKINARTFAWYQPVNMNNSSDPALKSILSNLLGQLTPGITAVAHGEIANQVTNNILTPGMENFLGTQNAASGAPKAFLNWVLLDEEQFKMVNSGVTPVPQITAGQQKQLLQANNGMPIEITKNGYLYVFVSNESIGNVYFDDIRIEHIHGPLTEETHYYPFGLTMAGISSKAASFGGIENKFKFNEGSELNNKEFSDGSGLDLYSTEFRSYDPQIGRFNQTDPLREINESLTPYSFCYNNPIIYNDPLGLDTVKAVGKVSQLLQPGQAVNLINTNAGISSYIYNPSDPNRDENGLVENGMTDQAEDAVTVVGKKSSGVKSFSNTSAKTGVSTAPGNNKNSTTATVTRSGFDIKKAIETLNRRAEPKSQGKCATYVRIALEAGGINTNPHPVPAMDYGPLLIKRGFTVIPMDDNYKAKTGDIVVIKGFSGVPGTKKDHPYGHIQMYNGSQWVSDFSQNHFFPGNDYNIAQPDYKLYRW